MDQITSRKERTNTKKSKNKNDESGELTSSDSSDSSCSPEITRKKFKKTEEGEIESDAIDTKLLKTKTTESHRSNEEILNSRLIQVRKLIESTKKQLDTGEHKLAKIERALKKAEQEDNKTNVKKCQRYKLKYTKKVEKLKENLKIYQSKKTLLIAEIRLQSKGTIGDTKSHEKLSSKNLIQKTENLKESKTEEKLLASSSLSSLTTQSKTLIPREKDTKIQTELSKTSESKSIIKLPYPVLNDKRDMKIILSTLESKKNDLIKKREVNLQNIKTLSKKSVENSSDRLEKLKQLDHALELQKEKIEKQLEYIKLSFNLEILRNRSGSGLQNTRIINDKANQLNDMYNFMKQENIMHLKKQEEIAEAIKRTSELEAAEKKSKEKISTTYDQVNNSLACLLAHIAATAHSAASFAAGSHFYSTYFPSKELENQPIKAIDKPTLVPLKTELARASSTFANLKDKISSFFMSSNDHEQSLKKKLDSDKQKSGLSLLINNYAMDDDDDQVDVGETELAKTNSTDIKIQDDSTDQEDDSDIEIYTTSEISQGSARRNYLLPSIKTNYFPLKSSIHDRNSKVVLNYDNDYSKVKCPKFNDFLYE